MRITMLLMLLALSVLFAACSDAVVVDRTANGGTISVAVGGRFTVELESNPSTGFTWVVVEAEGLALIEEHWTGDSDLTGSPGISTFLFEATSAGTNDLEMVYTQAWTDGDSLDRSFSLTVSATDSG